MKFEPSLQLIKDIVSGDFVAAEALARWHVHGGIVSPSSMIVKPNWAEVDFRMALFIRDNIHVCMKHGALFINVSEQTLSSDILFNSWVKIIESLLKQTSHIVVEITEEVTDASLSARWRELAAIGVKLALDDYGKINSSFERLCNYGWHYCKFDARQLDSLIDNHAIHHCIKNKVAIIVECVESSALMNRAKLLGLCWQQGFYHAEPETISGQSNKLKAQV
ncbi:EAL domain-containing protein [Edwardsiella piscicida]|uniref:Sensory box sensor/GGDEF/EAL domain protein n=1 Tax=Edwardsiella anguillarum ET080813 TaxID=667120 RepID=A0A076LVI6_9GAMM|nr:MULTISPECIES: EAL domain-containing protein [Edwardsiella]EGA8339121.1 EAL domain-containing protein [Salmonella enterica subsp. enterica serovar Saintpaul]EKG9744434.1 EAL domain-containing protein [Salmonella enterica]NJS89705.1 EAL domain-containing protein [Escherichia coli]AIJ10677.1 Sensory box sensor/GGDEF/EAL domain protein [Edwardsiella anguillarum ET080813]EKS7763334.1 EAL domain-containing protein [Edwardsiella ictaluri]